MVYFYLEQPIFGARKGYNEEVINERKVDYLKVTIYYKSLTVKQTYESALISVSDKFILYKFTIKLNNLSDSDAAASSWWCSKLVLRHRNHNGF